jgi:alpha-ketoglutarate-dependent taurine dioxygenase
VGTSLNSLQELQQRGWTKLTFAATGEGEFLEEIKALSARFGVPVCARKRSALIEKITPTSTDFAKPSSLSKQFGLGSFPLHTDCAHWTRPPRYVILASLEDDKTRSPTILLDSKRMKLSVQERQDIADGLFLAANGRRSFFCSIFDDQNHFIRFDPGCMRPHNESAIHAMQAYSTDRHTDYLHEIYWSAGQAIVIDNWRLLHGRNASPRTIRNREIWRVLVQ